MVAVAVLVGYLLALGGTSVGQGRRLMGHLAHAHAPATPAAPKVFTETPAEAHPMITTLRPRPSQHHAHGHPHRHAKAEPHAHDEPPAPPRFVHTHTEAHGDFHEHGGVVHTHEAPPAPEPGVVLTVALDQHQLPVPTTVPAPPHPPDLAFGEPDDAPRALSLPVETPPPLTRG